MVTRDHRRGGEGGGENGTRREPQLRAMTCRRCTRTFEAALRVVDADPVAVGVSIDDAVVVVVVVAELHADTAVEKVRAREALADALGCDGDGTAERLPDGQVDAEADGNDVLLAAVDCDAVAELHADK